MRRESIVFALWEIFGTPGPTPCSSLVLAQNVFYVQARFLFTHKRAVTVPHEALHGDLRRIGVAIRVPITRA